jgi:hypothetical protein
LAVESALQMQINVLLFYQKNWVVAFKRSKKVKDEQRVGRAIFHSTTENVDVVHYMILYVDESL